MNQPTNQPRWPELRELQPGVIPLGPLSMSEIFLAARDVLVRHAALLFGTSLVVLAVTRVLVRLITAPMLADLPPVPARPTEAQAREALLSLAPIITVDTAVSVLALVLITGIGTVAVGRAVLGKDLTLGEAFGELKGRTLPLLGLTLVVSVAVAVGMLALVVPGVWLAVLFLLAAPALVLERSTIGQALTRSKDLVRNHWWRIFGMLLVLLLIILGVNQLAVFATGTESPADGDVFTLSLLGEIVAGALTAPFAAVVTALIYVDRRFHTDDLALELARAAGLR